MGIEERVVAKIKSQGGSISFREYMQLALYYPNYGYYSSSRDKISSGGDFITATSQTSLFARTFARQFATILREFEQQGNIVEFGSGTGKFAADCMDELSKLGILPEKYFIVELSTDLKLKQQKYIKQNIPNLFDRFVWLEELPKQKLKAIVFANEVLDAMPVDIFNVKDNKLIQQGVTFDGSKFKFVDLQVNDSLFEYEAQRILEDDISFEDGYVSELNIWIRPWIKALRDCLERAVVFLCDYGYHRKLYYTPARNMGTLACYHKHQVNFDPFINIGLQDITSHVDFTTVAEAATEVDFELDGYMNQANFLKRAGIDKVFINLFQSLEQKDQLIYNSDLKELLLGDKLAETFKVICFSLGFETILEVFDNEDNIDYLL
ncbi:class I SAM-dependent methyltransferase [Allofrancisella frigidaquae]|uniref:SAM-dependent methyltransferase n=1 Tax=Allofrancisella frigidaquae TaxID=1085644 RepID=A0A6M3HSE8_9GAMM|nr:SAM-dependent methyltransferase [Allofrancisella frigidaquae]QIV94065.1 SAM-dependent methyltransferase [Allofrancisella frigidaquae]